MRKLIATAAIAASALALAACSTPADDSGPERTGAAGGEVLTAEPIVVKVGASPTPHAEILEFVQENLAAEAGISIEIIEFTDYVLPNEALATGEIDANYFQHVPYFDQQVADQGFAFSRSGGIHIEPFGAYSNSLASLDELPEGGQVAIPNDPSNGGRALFLLADHGVITLDSSASAPTILDITGNPKNLRFVELDASQLTNALPDVALAVINGNFALDSGLIPTQDALVLENPDGNPYANIVAYRAEDETSPAITTLIGLLTSEEVREYITTTWSNGEIIPAF